MTYCDKYFLFAHFNITGNSPERLLTKKGLTEQTEPLPFCTKNYFQQSGIVFFFQIWNFVNIFTLTITWKVHKLHRNGT